MKTNLPMLVAAVLAGVMPLAGCKTEHTVRTENTVRIEPIEVKPIHMTLDVNIRVERELDDFFKEVEQRAEQEPAGGKTEGGAS